MNKLDLERLLEYVDGRYPDVFASVSRNVKNALNCIRSNSSNVNINYESNTMLRSTGAVIRMGSTSMGVHQTMNGDYRVRTSCNGYDYECFFDRNRHEFYRGEIKENGHTRLACGTNDGVNGNDWYILKWDGSGNQEMDVDGLSKSRFWNTQLYL